MPLQKSNKCKYFFQNIEDLVKKLPNISKSYLVPDPNFSHIDFIIGINTSKLVNENIITYLRENN